MKTKTLVFTAIFITLSFLSTYLIKFPISIGWGYMHFGDAAVILGGILLGPIYGAIAGGLGSALADYAGGYGHYMLATFIVKAALAFAVGIAYKNMKNDERAINEFGRKIYHIAISIIIVTGGYFIADLILGNLLIVDLEGGTAYAYAAYGVIPNIIQSAFGAVVSAGLYLVLKKPFNDIYNS